MINVEASVVTGIDLGPRPEAVTPDTVESVTHVGMMLDGIIAAPTATRRELLLLTLKPQFHVLICDKYLPSAGIVTSIVVQNTATDGSLIPQVTT